MSDDHDDRVEQVLAALEPTPASEVAWPVSRRTALRALAATLGLGGATGSASAQSVGTVHADTAVFSNYGSEATPNGYAITIDDTTFTLGGGDLTLPEGTAVSEVATPDSGVIDIVGPDGNVLFEDRPDIPDTSMFQSPIYQWYPGNAGFSDGDSSVDYPEVLAGLGDATAQGDPTYNSEYSNTGTSTIDYDGGSDGSGDYHTWSGDASLPTGSTDKLSMFAVFYTDNTDFEAISGFNGNMIAAGGSYALFLNGVKDKTGGSISTGTLDTIGATLNFDTGDVELYGGGDSTPVSSDSGLSLSNGDTEHSHASYEASGNNFKLTGGIAEIVYSDAIESGSAYEQFHNDRI